MLLMELIMKSLLQLQNSCLIKRDNAAGIGEQHILFLRIFFFFFFFLSKPWCCNVLLGAQGVAYDFGLYLVITKTSPCNEHPLHPTFI